MFQKSIFSTRARDHFWRDMGAQPVFRTFLFEVVRGWNLVCRYFMWPGLWMSEPNFNFRPWAFFARTPFIPTFRYVQRLRVDSSSNLKSRISGSLPNMCYTQQQVGHSWSPDMYISLTAPPPITADPLTADLGRWRLPSQFQPCIPSICKIRWSSEPLV